MIVTGERGDRRAFGPANKSTLVGVLAAGEGPSACITKSMSRMSTEDVSWRFPLQQQQQQERKEGREVTEVSKQRILSHRM